MKKFRAVLAVVMLAAIITAPACRRDADDEAAAKPAATSGASTDVALSAGDVATNGIEVAELRQAPDNATAVTIGYATVVDSKVLLAETAQLVAVRAQARQSETRAATAASEAARLKGLYDDGNNASERAVEEASSAYTIEEASSRAATAAVGAALSAARSEWGPVLAEGMVDGAEWIRKLQWHEAVLVESVEPADAPPPLAIKLEWGRRLVPARHLAASPRVDPNLQRPSHFYLCDEPALPSGLTLPVVTPSPGSHGVLVPEDAVVWYGGHAWVFVETAAGHFRRTTISATEHVSGGFIEAAMKPGTRVAVHGAAQLLSEQNKPAIEE